MRRVGEEVIQLVNCERELHNIEADQFRRAVSEARQTFRRRCAVQCLLWRFHLMAGLSRLITLITSNNP